jgi:iron complex outermembrane receptor protein
LSKFGFHNDGDIDAQGLEFEAEIRTKHRFEALTSYVIQHATEVGSDVALTNSPRHMFKTRGSLPLSGRATAALEWQFIGSRATLGGATVPTASLINASADWRLTPSLTLTGSIRNMFNDRYWDPGSDEHIPDAIQQDGRTARIGLRWTISGR